MGNARGHHPQAGEAICIGEVSTRGFQQIVLAFEIGGDDFEPLKCITQSRLMRSRARTEPFRRA